MEPSTFPASTLATLWQQGLQQHQAGDYPGAIACYQKIMEQQPGHISALHHAGLAAFQMGQQRDAIELIQLAQQLDPDNPELHSSLGDIWIALHNYPQALGCYHRVHQLQPDNEHALCTLGTLCQHLGELDDALACYNAALALNPHNPSTYSNRGNVLRKQQQPEQALKDYQRAIELAPNYADAYYNRGVTWQGLECFPQALADYERALELDPTDDQAWCNKGLALKELGQHQAALLCYQNALDFNPDAINSHWNLALQYLQLGHYPEGFQEYEWRWQNTELSLYQEKRHYPQARWTGQQALHERTLFIYAEQGLGDTLQFCRYIPLLAQQGARIIFEVQAPLLPLLQHWNTPQLHIIPKGQDPGPFDYHSPLLSLPLACQTRLDTIPSPGAYLHADPARRQHWQAQLSAKPRIGIAWSGNRRHRNDHHRSIALSDFLSLCQDDYEYVVLQTELSHDEQQQLRAHPHIRNFNPHIHDFADTAALADLMDLIITVDTSIAHLAGALAKPVWILLPHNPDWRWHLHRPDSPWYPTATLHRRPTQCSWGEFLKSIQIHLPEH